MPSSGQPLSHYKILEPIGKGGMGEVFLAEDTILDRKVALKFLPEKALQDPVARKRFFREAKSAASLDNPFICKIYETGEVDGEPFIAMEFVEGETLGQRLARGPLSVDECIKSAVETAEALEVAHEHGIIHRDLKPANIMLTSKGHAKVMDFGLAKQVVHPGELDPEGETALTENLTAWGTAVGTLAYMSPEQLRAEPLHPPSDIFSFGVVLSEMITGRHPFFRPSTAETIKAIMHDPPPPLEFEGDDLPAELVPVLEKALAKDPAERYQTAGELAADLRQVSRTLSQTRSRLPLRSLAAAVVVAGIVVAVSLFLALRDRAPVEATTPDPLSVLIADFDNQTGDEVFSGVLEKATAIVIEDASFVTPFKRGTALKAAEAIRPGANVLDEELAQLVAQREGVNIVITGSITKSEENYVVSMTAIDAVSGDVASRQRFETDSREEVLTAVGRLAGQIRENLGDTDPEAIRRAAEESFTATTLEAAHAYVHAQDLLTEGKWQEAIEAFSALVENFPEMGRAYSGIAVALANMGRREEATGYYELAMSHIDHMTEREKGRTRGTYYLMTRNYEKASEVYEQLVDSYPFDEAARVNLVLGYFYGRQMDRSLVAARDAVEAFPHSAMAQANLALVAMYASDFETAKTQADFVLEAHPAYETAYVCLGLSQLALDDTAGAIDSYERLAGISDWGASLAATGLADIAIYEGRLNDAATILEAAAATDLEGGNEAAAANKLFTLAHAELTRGRSDQAAAAAQRAVKIGQQEQVLFEAARVYLETDRKDEALALAAQLAERLAPEPQAYAKLIEGEIALANAEANRAVTLFSEAQEILDTWIGRVDLGRAYLESGAFPEAHAEFEAALARRGEAASVFLDDVPSYHYLPPVYYYLGRALEGLGSPGAADSYRAFLEIKEPGDGDPLVTDARRRFSGS